MQNIDPMIETLPESIRPVAEHLGMGIVRRMIEAVPGTRLHIPKGLIKNDGTGGIESAFYQLDPGDQKALMREFGGDVIIVPTTTKTWRWRHIRIRDLAAKGYKANEIALEVGMHRRSVLAVIAKLKKQEQQKSMAPPSISDGHLTPHAESASYPRSGKAKTPA